jgi:hypothetical protein
MLTVVKSQGATLANLALPLVVQTTSTITQDGTTNASLNPGLMVDAFYAAYQIYSFDGTQVYPSTAGTWEIIDPVADHVETGLYAAHWDTTGTPGPALGAYYIQWQVVPLDGDPVKTFSQDFELASMPVNRQGPNYTSIQSLRDEGLTSAKLSDAAAVRLIQTASQYVTMFTGREFLAQRKTLRVDGTNGRDLPLEEPIVAISGLAVSLVSQFTASDLQVLAGTFRIFNRHLSLGMLNPDDRESPKLAFLHDDDLKGVNYVVPTSGYRLTQLIWPKGQENCRIYGLFGYTCPSDGSFMGKTPELIQTATKLLCFRYLDKVGTNNRDDATKRMRLLTERTKDQSYSLAHNSTFTGYTGDPEIDTILCNFTRGPRFGAV